jgi:hypothetical protein
LLVLLPGETAAPGTPNGKTGTPLDQTAGSAIANGIVVKAVDANWNVVSSSTANVTLTSSDSNATIADDNGGTTGNMTLVSGSRTLSSFTFKTAGTRTVTASASGLTAGTSANVTVNAGAFMKLQLLVPGETAAPGSATGKIGTPTAQFAGVDFDATVNAVDANWNLVNTVSDTVGVTSSDAPATLPMDTALVSGTITMPVLFNSNGSFTITATDLSDGSKTASTSPAITVDPAQFAPATGGDAIAADGAVSGAFTTLTGPTYSEEVAGEVGTGTIILNAPAGFRFDTGGTAPTVLSEEISGSGNNPVQGNITSVTTNQITYTVTATSGNATRLTWQNIRVRPNAGTPLASGTLLATGTAKVPGLSTNSNLGVLREVAGAASDLVMPTQPSVTATAGVPFAQQPVLEVRDQFGNLRNAANGVTNSTVVTAARSAGSGTLQGTTSMSSVNGIVTFTNLSHNVATNITIQFTSGSATATSAAIAISPAAADRLVFATQPGSTTYGSALNRQPMIKTQDAFGNDTTLGIGTSKMVTLAVTTGTGSLQGATSLDIGTGAGNGTVAFSGLAVSAAGTGKHLTASVASGLASVVSSSFDVTKATVTGGITANSKIYDGTTATTIASRTLTGVIGIDNVSLSGGTASFASKTVGTGKTVTATGLSLSGLDAGNYQLASTSATGSANITARSLAVSAAGVNKAYDGTTTATATLSDNRVAGDSLNTSYTSASFANKNVGTAKPVSVGGILVTGTDASNYTANTTASSTANITAKALTVAGLTANDKVYNGATAATLNTGGATLVGVVSGDTVTLNSGGATSAFADKNAGTGKSVTVSGLALSGVDTVNYSLSQPTTTASIIKATLTVIADNKTRTASASNPPLTATYTNFVGGETLATSGVTGSPALSTTTTNVVGTYPITISPDTLSADNYDFTFVDGVLTVTADAATKLSIQTQPSPTATAGGPFAQQPIVRVEDSVGNLITTDNGRLITATRSAGSGTLQGTVTATTVNGIATFANLSHNVATTITINFTASGLTSATSGNIVISPTTVSQLGFSTQPSGTRTGSPLATQPVVTTQDAYGNTSSIGLPANLNVCLALTSGSGSLLGTTNLDLGTAAGNGTATFTTVECSDAGTNKQLTASAAGFGNVGSAAFDLDGVERATGGTAIPSSTAGGAYTTLTGPVYYEYVVGDVGTGTIILNAPSGFSFDTGGTAPTVRIDRLTGSGSDNENINTVASGTSVAITSRTTTQITFMVTDTSSSDVTCKLTWQNVRVRPTAASPMASGNITKTGTSTMAVVTNSSTSFGSLVATFGDGEPAYLTAITGVPDGVKITFTGSPGYTYQILHAATLQNDGTAWVPVGMATTDAAGQGAFTDRNPTTGQGYYRAVSVGPSQGGY